MTLNYTAPLFIGCFVLVYAARNKIPVNWKLLSMVLLGFAGVVVLLSPTISPSEYFAAAVGIGAGFFTAVATSFVKRLGVSSGAGIAHYFLFGFHRFYLRSGRYAFYRRIS